MKWGGVVKTEQERRGGEHHLNSSLQNAKNGKKEKEKKKSRWIRHQRGNENMCEISSFLWAKFL